MAKVKSSKFGKVLRDIRQSNEQSGVAVSGLQKDVNELENTVLLILEKLRRLEKSSISKKRGGQLASTKTNVDTTVTPANDSGLEDETSKGILVKMYNFMVRNAERNKSKEENDRRKKRTLEKKKEVNYRKELIKAGLDPKFFKKQKGLLGKIGTGLKWGIFASIGIGLAGLVWIFQDEVTMVGKAIGQSIEELKTFLTKSFQTIASIYNRIMDVFKPLTDIIQRQALSVADSFNIDTSKGLLDGIEKFFTERISALINGVVDSITNWAYELGQSILVWAKTPWSPEAYKTAMATIAARMIAGPWGSMAFAGMRTATGIIDTVTSYANEKEYGPEYIAKVQELVATNPYQLRDVKTAISDIESGDTDHFRIGIDKMENLQAQKRIMKELSQLKESYRDKKLEQYGYHYVGPLNEDTPHIGYYKDGNGNIVTKEEVTKKLFQLGVREDVVEKLLKPYLIDPSKKYYEENIKPTAAKAEETYKQAKTAFGDISRDAGELGRKMSEPVTQGVTAVRQEFSGVSTPAGALNATAGVVTKATDVANKGVQHLATKDLSLPVEQMFKSYNDMVGALGQIGDTASQYNTWDKMSSFFSKLNPEDRMDNVAQDPHEDIANQEALWNQAKDKIAPVSKVYNNRGSSTSHDNLQFPPVRHSGPAVDRIIHETVWKPSVLR